MIEFTKMLVYCDDPSHTTAPVGPVITDPNLIVPEDVYLSAEFYHVPESNGPHWVSSSWRKHVRRVGNRLLNSDGQVRELLDDGTVLPPRRHWTSGDEAAELLDGTREKWNPRCEARTAAGGRCGQRGGRWKGEDRDDVFSQLAGRGVIGVSLRTLDLIKHSGIRSV